MQTFVRLVLKNTCQAMAIFSNNLEDKIWTSSLSASYALKTYKNSSPFSRSYIYNLISQGRFPAQVKLVEGGRGAGWWEHEIRAYIESRHQDTRGSGHNEEV